MKRLIHQNRVPHGGEYRLNLPEKGMIGHGNNFETLIRSIMEWRRANSVPIGLGFEDEVEQAVCEKYPVECDGFASKRKRRKSWGMWDIVRGTSAFFRQKLSGADLVDQAEANRRSALCSKCPARITFSKPCSGLCAALVKLISSTGGKSTPTDSDTLGCGICRCWTKVAVWYALEIQCVGVDETMKQEFAEVRKEYPCWKDCP
jgi:hypothetical protein